MSDRNAVLAAFCEAVSIVKRTRLDASGVALNQYLGGDLGIDSIEMLEIWFRIERSLEIRIPDEAKRNIYTVSEVIESVLQNRVAVSA